MVASLVVVTFPLEPIPTHGCVARVVEMWMWLGLLRANPIPRLAVATTTPRHNIDDKVAGRIWLRKLFPQVGVWTEGVVVFWRACSRAWVRPHHNSRSHDRWDQ